MHLNFAYIQQNGNITNIIGSWLGSVTILFFPFFYSKFPVVALMLTNTVQTVSTEIHANSYALECAFFELYNDSYRQI